MMKRPTVNSTEVSDEVASIFEDAMGFGDTQKHFEPPLQATDPAILKRQIMSWNEWKNEREWWAAREIERLRNLEAALHTAPDGRFTEGVSGDGVVILNDGLPLTISEVLALLNHRDPLTLESEFQRIRLRDALQSIANNTCCDKCQEAALVAHAALNPA